MGRESCLCDEMCQREDNESSRKDFRRADFTAEVMSSCEELSATAKRRMVEMLSLTSEGSAACWRSKGEDRLAQSGPAF